MTTGAPARCSALVLRAASRRSSAFPSPPMTRCFDILPVPDRREVTSHLDGLSSKETYKT